MKKSLGVKPYLFPMPVLMIATYGENGTVDVMNMAWGGICAENMVALNITESHKTAQNIKERGAFTISVADRAHWQRRIISVLFRAIGLRINLKKSGLHAVRSKNVDAPVIEEFPLTLECRTAQVQHDKGGFRVLGEIINVLADQDVLDEEGRVNPVRLNAFVFDQFQNGYYAIGER